ncbi:NUDIX hydrolase domain-like protein [Jimgerdemannia flammicorona]|uniref:NUDIX hydrolase domain-like protein n=1 Tax=Jimgerdemannia flammicorona TaxID=994334 RepID=A0A433QAY2_9FUNG|nr:NUDIX hydrolase domain-like protein [Jimgerdemannia flammicorona]
MTYLMRHRRIGQPGLDGVNDRAWHNRMITGHVGDTFCDKAIATSSSMPAPLTRLFIQTLNRHSPLKPAARTFMSTSTTTFPKNAVVEPHVLAKEPLEGADAHWIGLHRITYVDPQNRQRLWESAERKTRKAVGVDGVGIFPILRSATKPTRTLLVIQFRPAVGKKCVEFPAGLIDDNETPEQTAVRELEEETGYHGTVSYASTVMYSDPGLTNANMKLVIVEVDMDDDRNHKPEIKLEDGEFIETQIVPLEGLAERFEEMDKLGFAVDARLFHLAKGLALGRLLGL